MEQSTTELQKAANAGYLLNFYFENGNVHCKLHPTSCSIREAHPEPHPCILTRTIVYWLETPDGLKGVVVLDFEQDEESIHC
ncbi:MAG: hypothetical protein M0Q26_13485 [Chitinophagaceae bacterium]|nr:hypothetical protein [Chitinophagaceae bacterium]